MIENLALHGVRADDLVPSLMTTHTVANPEYDPAEARKLAEQRREDDEQDADNLPGMLFGNATNNSRAVKGRVADDVFLAPNAEKDRARPKSRTAKSAPAKTRSASRSKTVKTATRSQVEVAGKKQVAGRVR